MPAFEFVVEGPPKTVNAKNKQRYQAWIEKVRAVARREWSNNQDMIDSYFVTIHVTNYYLVPRERPQPPDVDNVLKPILDGMEEVVYENDNCVSQVISDRFDLAKTVENPSPILAAGLNRFSELMHIRVFWDEK